MGLEIIMKISPRGLHMVSFYSLIFVWECLFTWKISADVKFHFAEECKGFIKFLLNEDTII